jgi:hypothetical protein
MKYKRIFLNLTEFRVQNAVGRLGSKGPRSNNMPRAPRNVNPALNEGSTSIICYKLLYTHIGRLHLAHLNGGKITIVMMLLRNLGILTICI